MVQKLDEDLSSKEVSPMEISVQNVGGIKRCSVEFQPGVSILTGRNATNRTSLLRAVAGIFGGSAPTVKSDADEGSIELTYRDETYRQMYERQGAGVEVTGEAYTDKPTLVDSFASLLEDNPARNAVRRGEDLREVVMQPVDTDQITSEIRQLDRRIESIENRIESIEEKKRRLPKLQKRREDLSDDLNSTADQIESVRAEIDEYDTDEKEAKEAEGLLTDLENKRQQLEEAKGRLEQQSTALEQLAESRETVKNELDAVEVPDERLAEVEDEVESLERRKRTVESDIADLTQVIQFNDEIVAGDGLDIHGLKTDDDITATLDPTTQSVECWTCGSEVQLQAITERLDGLRNIVEDKRAERNEIEEAITDLEDQRRELRTDADRKSDLEDQLEKIDRKIEHRENKQADLSARVEDIQGEIEDIETRVKQTEELRNSDLADSYQRLSELEYERGQIEQQIADVDEEIAAIEDEVDELDDLEDEIGSFREQRRELRTRIEDLEQSTVEAFNDHMAEMIEILEYENVARVWIERKGQSRSNVQASESFELHLVRETADGTGYEDVVENLSESEREVIGLVVALVGYLVHEVHREVPVMLLDSLEAIDAERIAKIVDYFGARAPFLLVALLPEDEQVLPGEYERIPADKIDN
jgi:DNA repair ATPase RecN